VPDLVFDGTEGVGSRFLILRSRFRRYRGCQVPFSCFARPDIFAAVPRAWGPVFMFCALGHVFGGKEGVGSHFHVLRAQTSFRRYRGRLVQFSYFALSGSIPAVPRASGPVFIFCAPGIIFGGPKGVGFRFSCFALLDLFSAVRRASILIFMFCAPGLAFGVTEGVGSHFHILRSRTHFRRYQGRRVPFSCFARPDSFSAVPRALCPVFIFCAPGLFLGGIEGVRSRFHALCASTHFRRYRGRRFPFSYFARSD
jgi:hypothetical protein